MMEMKNIVPIHIATQAKERGFNEPSFFWYDSDVLKHVPITGTDLPVGWLVNENFDLIAAPYQLTLKMWIETKYGVFIQELCNVKDDMKLYGHRIYDVNSNNTLTLHRNDPCHATTFDNLNAAFENIFELF